jgi:hypothetical protein
MIRVGTTTQNQNGKQRDIQEAFFSKKLPFLGVTGTERGSLVETDGVQLIVA